MGTVPRSRVGLRCYGIGSKSTGRIKAGVCWSFGYVGLPLIDGYVNAGFKCLGFDVDPKKAELHNAGKTDIAHIKDSLIQGWLDKNQFEATIDLTRFTEADVILICVPTPLTDSRDPNLAYVVSATEAIAKSLRPLVVLESTTYPGTTRDVMLPVLEQSGSSNSSKAISPICRLASRPAKEWTMFLTKRPLGRCLDRNANGDQRGHVAGFLNMILAAKDAGVKRFVTRVAHLFMGTIPRYRNKKPLSERPCRLMLRRSM